MPVTYGEQSHKLFLKRQTHAPVSTDSHHDGRKLKGTGLLQVCCVGHGHECRHHLGRHLSKIASGIGWKSHLGFQEAYFMAPYVYLGTFEGRNKISQVQI